MPEIRARQSRTSTNTSNTNSSSNGVDPKDVEALNARLSDRRRERRQQRLRRTQKTTANINNHHGNGTTSTLRNSMSKKSRYRTKALLVGSLSIAALCSIWLLGFLWFRRMSTTSASGSSSTVDKTNNNNNNNKASAAISSVSDLLHLRKGALAANQDSNQENNNNDPENNRRPPQHPAIPVKANLNEVIDMRDLNQILPFDNPNGGAWTQGWDVQPVLLTDKKPLKIFVVPHSHCDPGWIKTFDDYFQSQTKQILTSVIKSLQKNPKRKFIWAEISYFEWWWKEQTSKVQNQVRDLLDNGQFEFVTGGWVQPDEANTQLYAMEIQLQEGHDFIRETFGEEYIPKYGWSIDPFGYSPTMAYLLKKYNFQGMLIQRVHYAIKKELAKHQQLEFIWRQTWDNKGDHDIFTHVMPFYSYDVPHTCGPDPSICCQFDFARLPDVAPTVGGCPWHRPPQKIHDRNVADRAMLLLDQYRKKASLYRSNVVIAPLGDDFRYQSVPEADMQFENYQRIFDYINENVQGVQIQFGTLSEYFEAAMGTFEAPILKGSFFTYADRDEDYWSGYFTSRIFDKALDRQLERVLYAATSMGASKEQLQESRRALSLFQHHDGVTGTAKDHVVVDYARRIHKAIRDTQDWMVQHYLRHYFMGGAALKPCWQSNAPRGLTDNLCQGNIVVYNPLQTPQSCGNVVVPGLEHAKATLPCELPGPLENSNADIQFDPHTGLMTHPIKEEWMVWSVQKGGAYLFFPGRLGHYDEIELEIEEGGFVVKTPNWKRTVVEKKLPDEYGNTAAIVLDFEYETFLQAPNEEWLVRFSSDISNQGVFHTDLNGYNFDTHHFRSDMPIQSQVFPMPTHASIEDDKQRLTVLSEHSQGTASLEEGAIDIWLDRRLMQDDDRGLGQGVRDNTPTRTRLRIVLEREGYDHQNPEFKITPFCKLLWKQLNHPLEMFGDPGTKDADFQLIEQPKKVSLSSTSEYKYIIPAVFMVYNRVDYFKRVIDSLRKSDYPVGKIPIIVSHDGHVEDMVAFVDSIKSEFNVIQIFHPHACSEHPHSFPGDDPSLNQNYQGDAYGNPRDGKITCCKHHFTWLMTTVFNDLTEVENAHGFLFLEEDYMVAPTVYETLQTGFAYTSRHPQKFFGVTLDISEGWSYAPHKSSNDMWFEKRFVTGPMAFSREIFEKIQTNAGDYCIFDDYNWDWSLVHLMNLHLVPFNVVVPGTLQAIHIGMEKGLHEGNVDIHKLALYQHYGNELSEFHVKITQDTITGPPFTAKNKMAKKGFGGWGHPADHEHCLKLFGKDLSSVVVHTEDKKQQADRQADRQARLELIRRRKGIFGLFGRG